MLKTIIENLSHPNLNKRSLFSKNTQANILAGLTVGIVALPLSMALAIASGVPPQHGLYTAIIAGIVIAVFGGSKVNISGPTAAFVVILLPIVQQYGLGGLLLSGLMAGILLVAMGVGRLGSLIHVIPYPVIVGFTSGIGVVIATIQIKDFFGLPITTMDGSYIDKWRAIFSAAPDFRWQELLIASITLAVMLTWPRLKTRVPAHLIALLVGTFAAVLLGRWLGDFSVDTVGSRFQFNLDGIIGQGIPPILPSFDWPWNLPDASGKPIGFSLSLINTLIGSAFAIAILGALESLLCAVVADGMAGTKHNPNRELIGQGLGNIIAPFFGGIPATAAIARTAASIRAGATSPLASVVHGLFILLSILVLAPWLAYIPMASMAALLLIVAWNMSEAKHFMRIVKEAPRNDIAVLLTCFTLTVLLDIEIAVAVGLGLAAILFIKQSIDLTHGRFVERDAHEHPKNLPHDALIYDINGPLFFGAAQRALSELVNMRREIRVVILDMTDVNLIDMTGIVALESIVKNLQKHRIMLVVNNLNPRLILRLRHAGLRRRRGVVDFSRNIDDAIVKIKNQ